MKQLGQKHVFLAFCPVLPLLLPRINLAACFSPGEGVKERTFTLRYRYLCGKVLGMGGEGGARCFW